MTLFVSSVGTEGACSCGSLVRNSIFADPVPLGTYRITHSTAVTKDIGLKTAVIRQLSENSCIKVIDTKVDGGCVCGLANIPGSEQWYDDEGGSERNDSMTGWVYLFEPPSFSWAELILCG